jgi:succinate-semialdehyde dehydrogenase / glutarate-semialdehyde dehydrogenase
MPIATVNPATGETERTFEPHGREEVQSRIDAAHRAHLELRDCSFATRAAWLRRAADLLDSEVDDTARLLTREMGKPIAQAAAEVRKCARAMRFYAEHAEEILSPTPLKDPSGVGASAAWTVWQPLGVVLAVMPWNFPLFQVVRFAAPALMAGNAALLKHASNVPQTALYLEDVIGRSGFPHGALTTLLVEPTAVATILEDPRVAAVSVTGSEGAGRAVAGRAGAELKKAVLELGGSDPFIVMPSADLDAAVNTAVVARTTNNGQSCVCAKRFVVHDEVYDEFSQRFTERMSALVVGDPMDPATEVGPLATRSGRDELASLVDDAVSQGATVLTGGKVPSTDGWYYPPTVVADLTNDMRLVMEEAFGPVAALYRVADKEEALAIANQTTFGLSSSVWSRDPEEQDWFTSRIEAGAVFINGMTASHPELPFGGIKASGYGRELAAEGMREFCNLKTVWRA